MTLFEMYTSPNQTSKPLPMSPRISFSNDFVESHHHHHHNSHHQQLLKPRSNLPPPPSSSSDFEFSVTGDPMIAADELFFQGKLLPFKEGSSRTSTTLREELLAGDGDEVDADVDSSLSSASSSKESTNSSGRWRDLLGLRKTHIGSRKQITKSTTSIDSASQEGRAEMWEIIEI